MITVLVIGATVGIFYLTVSSKKKAEAEKVAAEAARTKATTASVVMEFPISGEGHARRGVGLKAYLDPQRSFTRPSGPAKYVFAEDTSLFFDDTEGAKVDLTAHRKEWQQMPAGKYVIYPLDRDDIFFKWWQ